ncbi:PP2C family serine/threonine-protein phosphatase [Actinomadura kijaniata]|uniref:PP2C family serine/threonine-protein phosphatase n=1 Tax=Actinomadura kijaniata TaxID=46161 RepID=UPI003F1A40E1
MEKTAEMACPQCGEVVYAGEGYCEACGQKLGGATPPEPARTCTGCGATSIDAEGYCERCGLRQPAARDHLELELPGANGHPLAVGASDRGKRYSRNEDALALSAHPTGVAAVVCDGVGSSPRPHEASRAAADAAAAELASRLAAGEDAESATRAAIRRAAEAVTALAASEHEAPSCTYVSAVTTPKSVTVGWIGDSRVYWLPSPDPDADPDATRVDVPPADPVEVDTADLNATAPDTAGPAALTAPAQLTEDDSWAAYMVAQGALTEEEAEAHPNAHVITGWLGADAGRIQPNVRTYSFGGPGTVLVCSDGLWNYLPRADALAATTDDAVGDPARDPLGTARALVRHALEAGGRDNITVAVIPVTLTGTEQP